MFKNIFFQNPDLLRWFKDFVGFKDAGGFKDGTGVAGAKEGGVGASEPLPTPPLAQPRHERMTGDAAMEIGISK